MGNPTKTEYEVQLIKLVEFFPHLYQSDHKHYRATGLTKNAWDIIAEKIVHRDPEECKAKWQSIRSQFRNDVIAGKGNANPYWDKLQFVLPYVTPRRTVRENISNRILVDHSRPSTSRDTNDTNDSGVKSMPVLKNGIRSLKRKHQPEQAGQEKCPGFCKIIQILFEIYKDPEKFKNIKEILDFPASNQ